jgi:nicotinic acid mononucleotide adenylyltransferase
VKSLHRLLTETDSLLHVCITGAGPRLLHEIWQTPGCSAYFMGADLPYNAHETDSLLGFFPEGYTSESTAYHLAMCAYIKSAEVKVVKKLTGDPLGVGICAAVATNRELKGGTRGHMVVISKDDVGHREIPLESYHSDATGQRLDNDMRLSVLARTSLQLTLSRTRLGHPGQWQRALDLLHEYPVFHPSGLRSARSADVGLYLPATLNPLHDGHRTMCTSAESDYICPQQARYLVSTVSPHKGSMSIQQILGIVAQVRAEKWSGNERIVEFTADEPLFINKARKRPGSSFIIGADTMKRMLDPRWGPDPRTMLDEMARLGTRFLVRGRTIDGKWVSCRDIDVPWPHGNLFRPIGGRVDISSTEIRKTTQ